MRLHGWNGDEGVYGEDHVEGDELAHAQGVVLDEGEADHVGAVEV